MCMGGSSSGLYDFHSGTMLRSGICCFTFTALRDMPFVCGVRLGLSHFCLRHDGTQGSQRRGYFEAAAVLLFLKRRLSEPAIRFTQDFWQKAKGLH